MTKNQRRKNGQRNKKQQKSEAENNSTTLKRKESPTTNVKTCNDLGTTTKDDIISFANFIYNQIKLQQEVRDRWFGLYLAIIGGVVTFATFALTFIKDQIKNETLKFVVGTVFALASLLGILFYLLFLRQRINTRLHYRVLAEVQSKLINEYLTKSYDTYYPHSAIPFRRVKRGADYYSGLIQNVLTSSCFLISCYFILSSFGVKSEVIVISSSIAFLISLILMKFIYDKFEKKI